jgi:hypothetical protein
MLPTAPTPATDAASTRVLTWLQADRLSPHDVIDRWCHHEPAALHADEPEHHPRELALMTVAAEWLTCWQPISAHRAILAGATPLQVSEAAGASVRDVYERWQKWADTGRGLIINGRPSISEEAYATVLASFSAAYYYRGHCQSPDRTVKHA